MKIFFTLCLLAVVGIAIVGCGATPLTQNQVALQTANYTAQGACYDRLATQDVQLATLLGKVPADQLGLVVVLQSVQENNKALMAIATGNNYNPCASGASAFDVQIAEVKAKNGTVKSVTGDVLGLGKWVVGGVTILGVADKISGDTFSADNGSEINQGSKNTSAIATGTTATAAPDVNNEAPNSNEGVELAPTSGTFETNTTGFTLDDPNCSLSSRAEGKC